MSNTEDTYSLYEHFTLVKSLEQKTKTALFLHLDSPVRSNHTGPKEESEERQWILEEELSGDFTPKSLMMAHFPNN